jgi:hypothetical protein
MRHTYGELLLLQNLLTGRKGTHSGPAKLITPRELQMPQQHLLLLQSVVKSYYNMPVPARCKDQPIILQVLVGNLKPQGISKGS